MSGEASPAQIAGFAVALRAKGETAPEVAGLAATMLAHADPVTVAGPGGRHRRHRRRPGQHGQHLDDGGGRGRRGRGARGQARQPGGVRSPGRWTCSRRSACRSTSPAEAVAAASTRSASGSASPRCSTRRCGTPGRSARELGVPTVVQLPRAADQPGPARRRRDRLRRRALGPGHGRGVRRAGRPGAGVPRRRRARRADHDDHLDGLGGRATAACASSTVRPGGARHPGARPRATCAAATPPTTPRWPARCSPASRAGPRRGGAQRRRGAGRAHEAVTGEARELHEAVAAAVTGPRAPSTPAARRCSTAGRPSARALTQSSVGGVLRRGVRGAPVGRADADDAALEVEADDAPALTAAVGLVDALDGGARKMPPNAVMDRAYVRGQSSRPRTRWRRRATSRSGRRCGWTWRARRGRG